MPTDVLTVEIDTEEPRNARDLMALLVDGKGWDILASSSGAYIDPITRTAMLLPLPFSPTWQTSAAGNYARFGYGDYSLPTPSKWSVQNPRFAGDTYLHSLNVNEVVNTLATWPKNRGFLISWFAYSTGNGSHVQSEVGMGTGSDTEVRFRFWVDGKTEVYKNGTQVGEGNLYERHVSTQTQYGKQTQSTKHDSKSMAGQIVDVMIIPCRRREILIVSNQGGGFKFSFEDIDPNDPDPTIVGPGTFFWHGPVGQVDVQCAPLRHATSGYVVSKVKYWRTAPPSGASIGVDVFWDNPGFGTVSVSGSVMEPDGVTPFSPDGVKTACRIRVDMVGDSNATPFVYGALPTLAADIQNTDGDHATVLDDWLVEAQLTVPDSPTDVTFSMTLKNPDAIEDAGAAKIKVVENRPIEIKIGSVAILTGRTKSPTWVEGLDDTASRILHEARDRCKAMEEYRFRDPIPLDGRGLEEGFEYCARLPGYPAEDMDIEAIGFTLPTIGAQSEGEFSLVPEIGDTALEWMVKLHQMFAANYVWGWRPTATGPKMRIRSIDTLEAADPVTTLYGTRAEAITAGVDAAIAHTRVFRSFKDDALRCEANEIWVTGRNPRTGLPLQATWKDAASQDPTLAPADRPDNWLGEPRVYGFVDSSIIDTATAVWSLSQFRKRLPVKRFVAEWESEFLLLEDGAPAWRGDRVTLEGRGTYRILSLNWRPTVEHASTGEGDPDMIWRPTLYTGVRTG